LFADVVDDEDNQHNNININDTSNDKNNDKNNNIFVKLATNFDSFFPSTFFLQSAVYPLLQSCKTAVVYSLHQVRRYFSILFDSSTRNKPKNKVLVGNGENKMSESKLLEKQPQLLLRSLLNAADDKALSNKSFYDYIIIFDDVFAKINDTLRESNFTLIDSFFHSHTEDQKSIMLFMHQPCPAGSHAHGKQTHGMLVG
jgi:hypothetical protein